MSNKIKYCPERGAGNIEFKESVVYIELPNGDRYSFKYDARDQGLIINKVESARGESAMIITPHVSNQIMIK
jgi:hypothetical protein